MKKLKLGVGVYEAALYVAKVGGKVTREYRMWYNMLNRCYNPKFHKSCPAYVGCSVDHRFHNFQDFSGWVENQVGYGVGDFELDKDLLLYGNKVYSPDICLILPQPVNVLITSRRNDRCDFPIGVTWNKKKKESAYEARVCVDGVRKFLGGFSNPSDAFAAYKKAKEDNMRRMANLYKDVLDQRAYDALVNYDVLPTH